MEQTIYTSRASQRRGECHAVEATARLDQLLRAGKYTCACRAGPRQPLEQPPAPLRAVKVDGRWIDVARTLITEGHAIWLPNHREYAWNRDYSVLARPRRARPAEPLGPRLLRRSGPNEGPAAERVGQLGRRRQRRPRPQRRVGADQEPRPGQRAPARRLVACATPRCAATSSRLGDGPARRRDHRLRRDRRPTTTSEFYWGLRGPAFENVTRDETAMGDGAYMFDPQGDLRLSMIYPCREACADPQRGSRELDARSRRAARRCRSPTSAPRRSTSSPTG